MQSFEVRPLVIEDFFKDEATGLLLLLNAAAAATNRSKIDEFEDAEAYV
jgi:hypothetical protein